jgi:hypothetical protein
MRPHHVDADVLVVKQRVARAEQEHRREQVPLQLEPRVRGAVEQEAGGGVGGAHQNHHDHGPHHGAPDPFVQPVDGA